MTETERLRKLTEEKKARKRSRKKSKVQKKKRGNKGTRSEKVKPNRKTVRQSGRNR